MNEASRQQRARGRARTRRLEGARQRRDGLDPARMARERAIDEAAVDVELAWESRAAALAAVASAEVEAHAAITRLLGYRMTTDAVAQLTGLDAGTVRRLRRLRTRSDEAPGDVSPVG